MRAVLAFKEIAKNRYREQHGLYYDEFELGDTIEHRPGRTVTEADNIWQSLVNLNSHPLHIDRAYGEATEFHKNIVSSLVTLSIVGGMSTNGTSARALANLGWDNIRLHQPVFVGDTLYAESTVMAMRLSESREECGIVTFETRGIKHTGEQFITFVRSALIPTSRNEKHANTNY